MRNLLSVLGMVLIMGIATNTQSYAHDLKELGDDAKVEVFVYCGGYYSIVTKTGKVYELKEMHVQMKTDSTPYGPHFGQPIIQVDARHGEKHGKGITVYFSSFEDMTNFTNFNCGAE